MKTLRRIGFLFLAVMLCFNFTACGDDDDDEDDTFIPAPDPKPDPKPDPDPEPEPNPEPNPNPNPDPDPNPGPNTETTASKLVGTWQQTWSKGYDIWDGKKEEWDESETGFVITMNADGTGTEYDVEYDETSGVFKWWVDGDQLYIKDQSDNTTEHGTIQKLDATTLVLHFVEQNYEETSTYKKVK